MHHEMTDMPHHDMTHTAGTNHDHMTHHHNHGTGTPMDHGGHEGHDMMGGVSRKDYLVLIMMIFVG